MKVHRVILLIIDTDDLGGDCVREVIESQLYPNHCIAPSVMQIDTRDVEWSDDHPLNKRATVQKAFAEMFGE